MEGDWQIHAARYKPSGEWVIGCERWTRWTRAVAAGEITSFISDPTSNDRVTEWRRRKRTAGREEWSRTDQVHSEEVEEVQEDEGEDHARMERERERRWTGNAGSERSREIRIPRMWTLAMIHDTQYLISR